MTLNPSERPLYPLTIIRKFAQMNFPESFSPSDFAEERDPKKMARVLSWLFQFCEALAPANDYAIQVWNTYKERASHAASLREQIASLGISNKAEESKRSEYRKKISDLNLCLSDVLASKRQISERVASESRKLSVFAESEKADSAESSSLSEKLESLRTRRETLCLQVIENPDRLPEAVDQLKEKQSALELEMQDIRSKTFQVDQSISEFKRLHEVIEQQLVAVTKDCHSLLSQTSQSKVDIKVGIDGDYQIFVISKKLDKELFEHTSGIELVETKISASTEQLRLAEHRIVKVKMLEATQKAVRFDVSTVRIA
ncbi:unnamed protein product [Mesocestoides corti]|uniref:IFT81_CH domain-containing protein n=1 Tax=Mesocestoides corti TaxID=53468 RepID=A0A0R3U3R3_MESCO|nr:unnamed protein product [Mesocestoides corti]